MDEPTWEAACEIEPGLRYLERLAEATAAVGTEQASWAFFRKALIKHVGLYARRQELKSVHWQRLAHAKIKAALGA